MTKDALPLPCLMIVVETTLPGGGSVEPAVVAAIEGGVNCVQLRDKSIFPDDLRLAALELRDVTRGRAKLIVNDAKDIAVELRLDGVHLPEAAFDIEREGISWPFLVGRSVHSIEAALRAQKSGADYIIAGNIFESPSQSGSDGVGLEFLRRVCDAVSVPVLAVGGIKADRVADCIRVGASGIVTHSGIVAAADPGAKAKRYAEALAQAWSARQQNV